jgi:type IV pilus assembly protein PilB
MSGRLGELLVRENLISVQQLRKAQQEQQKGGGRIGTALIKTGAIDESKLTDFLSKQYGVPSINLKEFDIDPEIIKLVSKEVAEKHVVIPVNRAGPSLIVAMCDPSNIYAVDDLKFLTGYNIEPVVASEVTIREAIEKYYAEKGPSLEDLVGEVTEDVEVSREEAEDIADMARAADEAPVVKLVNLILLDAIKKAPPTFTSSPTKRISVFVSVSTVFSTR